MWLLPQCSAVRAVLVFFYRAVLYKVIVSADRRLAIIEQEESEGGWGGIRRTKSICILCVRYRQEYDTVLVSGECYVPYGTSTIFK